MAGNKCIWLGGVGNFIKSKPLAENEGYYGCMRYQFNLSDFLRWGTVVDFLYAKAQEIKNKHEAIIIEESEINGLLDLCTKALDR